MAAPSWSELPRDLLGAVIARLDLAADIARFRAVCHCWRSAVREHAPSRGRPPRRIILPNGYPDDNTGDYDLPKNARCIGSSGCWLALAIDEEEEGESRRCTYYMYNPYSATTVALPELDAVIGNASELFKVRKVLVRSTPGDVIALLTNNYNYPVILVRPGKGGVWLPRPREVPYVYLIDIAFLGDKLYGITEAEDLVSITLAFANGDGGAPLVTGVERVIKHQMHVSHGDSSSAWSDIDVFRVTDPLELALQEQDDDDDDEERGICELMRKTGDDTIARGIDFSRDANFICFGLGDVITTTWYLVESRGELLMLRRKLEGFSNIKTRGVEAFKADVTTGTWTPVVGGLNGQALFISTYSCKSVSASQETVADSISFTDVADVFDGMKSETTNRMLRSFIFSNSTWLFHPELIV